MVGKKQKKEKNADLKSQAFPSPHEVQDVANLLKTETNFNQSQVIQGSTNRMGEKSSV